MQLPMVWCGASVLARLVRSASSSSGRRINRAAPAIDTFHTLFSHAAIVDGAVSSLRRARVHDAEWQDITHPKRVSIRPVFEPGFRV